MFGEMQLSLCVEMHILIGFGWTTIPVNTLMGSSNSLRSKRTKQPVITPNLGKC